MQSVQEELAQRDAADLAGRLDRLAFIVNEGAGQLDEATFDAAEQLLLRTGERLRMSGEHTVVAIAGGTGSGKSSIFNALAGLDLSAVGLRRPTTAFPYACVWGADPAAHLLHWLDVPPERRIERESELDADAEAVLRGLVLLDLPDHDSIHGSHQVEVDRLIDLVDVLVWVLDPQKYADAIVHDRYLRPLRAYSDVMIVVLNQADRLEPGQAQSCLQDLRRLLTDDGLGNVRTLLTSARTGAGIGDLRNVITTAVASRQASALRISADLDALAPRLARSAAADVDPAAVDKVSPQTVAELIDLAGVDRVGQAVAASYRRRGVRRTGWPLLAWPRRQEEPVPPLAVLRTPVERVATATASATTAGLPEMWQKRAVERSSATVPELADRMDAAVHAAADERPADPPSWKAVAIVQWALIAVALAGLVWVAIAAANSNASWGGGRSIVLGALVAVAALAVGLLCGVLFAQAIGRTAEALRVAVEDRLRQQIAELTDAHLLSAIRAELDTYRQVQQALRSFAEPMTEPPPETG